MLKLSYRQTEPGEQALSTSRQPDNAVAAVCTVAIPSKGWMLVSRTTSASIPVRLSAAPRPVCEAALPTKLLPLMMIVSKSCHSAMVPVAAASSTRAYTAPPTPVWATLSSNVQPSMLIELSVVKTAPPFAPLFSRNSEFVRSSAERSAKMAPPSTCVEPSMAALSAKTQLKITTMASVAVMAPPPAALRRPATRT